MIHHQPLDGSRDEKMPQNCCPLMFALGLGEPDVLQDIPDNISFSQQEYLHLKIFNKLKSCECVQSLSFSFHVYLLICSGVAR